MTPRKRKILEIKTELFKKGLNASNMARAMAPTENANEESVRVMISDMINQRRWFPNVAERVIERFELKSFTPAEHLQPLFDDVAA